ncbi:MAG TPA: hypothetical protein P5120_14585 [Spirochaetota bacterium]|nr:hypothetical protein [Spirochaetota bacterium]HPF07198.1 hypothetical protein [Spirochaetota bacterium]HPJ43690.1 hypothetical protein [Spirochaetota bacterium]HPR38697.1 hypothetical protein [Spirochaetota bacterium]HRX48745.1 hypothetical protein [Spirochaetota bacterium]
MKHSTEKHEKIKDKEDIKTLDKCLSAPHPEMARNNESDEPCEEE